MICLQRSVHTETNAAFASSTTLTDTLDKFQNSTFAGVLDQAKANELARAKRAHSSSHLTLALLYAEAGLLREAEHELRLVQRSNPNSDLARKLLRQIQSFRR